MSCCLSEMGSNCAGCFVKAEGVPSFFSRLAAIVADKLRGLTLGADDYITKPFDMEELVARINAVLRTRSAAGHSNPAWRYRD